MIVIKIISNNTPTIYGSKGYHFEYNRSTWYLAYMTHNAYENWDKLRKLSSSLSYIGVMYANDDDDVAFEKMKCIGFVVFDENNRKKFN